MHVPELFSLAIATGVLAAASSIPPALAPPLAPLLMQARLLTRRYLNGPALGFLIATAILAAIGVALQGWLSDKLQLEIPLGTVRWVLASPELGLWVPLLSWTTAAAGGALTWLRAQGAAQGLSPAVALWLVTLALWYAW